jgi:hypothetical protein
MARLKKPGGQALADKLGEVYAETRRNLSDSLGPPTDSAGPSALADTLDLPEGAPLRPALPFAQV